MRCGGMATMTRTKTVASKTRPGACGTRLTQPSPASKTSKAHKKLALQVRASPPLYPTPERRMDTDGGLTEEGVVQATVKKKRRYKPGTVALREIRKYEAKLTHRSLWSHTLSGQLHCVRMCMTHTVPSYTCTHADHGHKGRPCQKQLRDA